MSSPRSIPAARRCGSTTVSATGTWLGPRGKRGARSRHRTDRCRDERHYVYGMRPHPRRRRTGAVCVPKVAILDDYIGVALEYGDWTALPGAVEVTVYREAIPPERLIAELIDYEVIVITQQRARFPRAVLEGLPN